MNKSLRGASLVLLAIAPFAYLACSDDSVGGGGTFTLPTVDAATVPTVDAAASEQDADVPDAPAPTTATVLVVTTKKLPEAGVKVVFYDAAGTVLGTETTDAAGTATHTMPAGGSVTAVFGTSSQHELVTIMGVQPGDTLTALDPLGVFHTTFAVTPPTVANVPLPVGTTNLHIETGGCATGMFPKTGGTIEFYPYDCEHGSDAPTLVLVATDTDNQVIGTTATAAGVPLVSEGSTMVTFAGPWSVPSATDATSVTNLSTTGVDPTPSKSVRLAYSSGAGTDMLSLTAALELTNGTETGSYPRTFPAATFVQNEVEYVESQNVMPYGHVIRGIVTRGAPGATTLDFGTALPGITSSTVTGTATPTVTWISTAPLTATKGILAQLYWYDSESSGAWFIVAPPTATAITPPVLPMDLAQSGPLATSGYQTPSLVAAVDATFLPSYAAVRASAALLSPNRGIRNGNTAQLVRTLPVDGTLKLTAYAQNGD